MAELGRCADVKLTGTEEADKLNKLVGIRVKSEKLQDGPMGGLTIYFPRYWLAALPSLEWVSGQH